MACWQKHKKKHKEHADSVEKTPVISEPETEVSNHAFRYCVL